MAYISDDYKNTEMHDPRVETTNVAYDALPAAYREMSAEQALFILTHFQEFPLHKESPAQEEHLGTYGGVFFSIRTYRMQGDQQGRGNQLFAEINNKRQIITAHVVQTPDKCLYVSDGKSVDPASAHCLIVIPPDGGDIVCLQDGKIVPLTEVNTNMENRALLHTLQAAAALMVMKSRLAHIWEETDIIGRIIVLGWPDVPESFPAYPSILAQMERDIRLRNQYRQEQ